MQTALLTTQEVAGQVTPNYTKPDGTVVSAKVEAGTVDYQTSDAAIAEVVEDPNDETQFKIVARGVGTATVTISADADLGSGVKTITGEIAVEVTEAGATGFGITLGQPTEQTV